MSRPAGAGPAVPPSPVAGPRRIAAAARPVIAAVAGLMIHLAIGAGPAALPASAHTELLQGSPGPSQRVGGTVDFVDLVFLAPVSGAVVDLTGPDGEPVPGDTEVTAGQIIRFRMAALEAPGTYRVTYRVSAEDGDRNESSYPFTYQPEALQPVRLGDADVPTPASGSVVTGPRALGALLVVALVALCGWLALRLRRRWARFAEVAGRVGERTAGPGAEPPHRYP